MNSSLKSKAVSGVIWTSIERFGTYFIQLIIGIIIARILSPDDFGIIGMTAIFMAIANTLLDSGFGNALIQNRERNETDYSTAFYFNTIVGIILYLILYFSSPLIAEFYKTPILIPVCRVIGFSLILNSLIIPQTAKLTAEFKFKELSFTTIITQTVTGIIAIIAAYYGAGVWALVLQNVSSCFLRIFLIEYFTRWKPTKKFSVSSFKKMFSFGSKILCSGIINTIYSNLYTLVIGRIYNPTQVGYYTQGDKFAVLPSTTLLQVVMKVAYPLMAEIQDDTDKLKVAYQKFLRLPIFILYPVLTGLIVYAHPLIYILLGEKWLPTVPILQILCLGSFFDPLTHINLNILYVKGRTDLVLKLEVIKKSIAFLILFTMIPFGLWWLCAGRVFYGFIAYIINCHYTTRYINFGFWSQMKYNIPIIAKSLLMGGICYSITFIECTPIVQLTIGTIVGFITYLLIAIISKDESYADLLDIIKRKK